MGRGCKRREALSRPVPIVRGLDPSIRTHPIPPQLPPTPPQRGILKTQNTRIPRAHSGVEPPVPIPNTEVKRASADGTGRATAWESRSVRGIFPFAGVAQSVEHDLAKVGVAGSNPVSRSTPCPGGGIGRHAGLKILWPLGRAGSSPARGTKQKFIFLLFFCTLLSHHQSYKFSSVCI